MTDTEKVQALREILKDQIAFAEEHTDDEDYAYDMLYDEFNNLSRGDFVKIVDILKEHDTSEVDQEEKQ